MSDCFCRKCGKAQSNTEVLCLACEPPSDFRAQPCRHDQGTDMHYDHVTCRACGWICVDSSEHAWGRARNGWFPSKDAALEFKKYGTYPGYVTGSESPARVGGPGEAFRDAFNEAVGDVSQLDVDSVQPGGPSDG